MDERLGVADRIGVALIALIGLIPILALVALAWWIMLGGEP